MLGATSTADSASGAWRMFAVAFARRRSVFSFAAAYGPVAIDCIARWNHLLDDCGSCDRMHLATAMTMTRKQAPWGHDIAGDVHWKIDSNREDQTEIATWTRIVDQLRIEPIDFKLKLTIEPNRWACDGISEPYISRDPPDDSGCISSRWFDDTLSMYGWCKFELSMIFARFRLVHSLIRSPRSITIDWKENDISFEWYRRLMLRWKCSSRISHAHHSTAPPTTVYWRIESNFHVSSRLENN